MKFAKSNPPADWPRISSAIVCDGLNGALGLRANAFALRVLVRCGGGNIQHTETGSVDAAARTGSAFGADGSISCARTASKSWPCHSSSG